MRITSGRLRGRKLFVKSSTDLKPTEGIVKEAMISIVKDFLSGVSFLDLFAGTGAVAFEAYSNGAAEVFLVEKERRLVESIQRAVQEWEIPARVFAGDYRRQLGYFTRSQITFDMVFIDPPYMKFSYPEVVKEIMEPGLLKPGGWIIIERHHHSHPLSEEELSQQGLSPYRNRRYGSVCLDIYRSSNH